MNNTTTKYIKPIELYDVDILGGAWKNFSGADRGYGSLGNGKGSLAIKFNDKTTLRVTDDDHRKIEFTGEDVVKYLNDEGWNVRIYSPKREDEVPFYFMNVKFAYRNRLGNEVDNPPVITRIAFDSRNRAVKTELNESSVRVLDRDTIISADVKLSANTNFEQFKQTGKASAYLKAGNFVCEEDYFNSRYSSTADDDDVDELPFG